MKIKTNGLLLFAIIAMFAFIVYSPSHHQTSASLQSITVPKNEKRPTDPSVYRHPNPDVQQLLAEYEMFIRRAMQNNLAPGMAVAVVSDTSIIYLKGFGLRDATKQDSVDIHSVFRIGSVSKCFASVLAGILVDEKRLKWDDQVVKYLPYFKLKSELSTQNLTLRNVLSHTTSLPYHAFTDRVEGGANFDTLVYHLRDLDLLGKPGQFYNYQNVGYSLIGEVVRSATGKTYAENLKEKIFDPLHMQTASASYEAIMQNSNVAKPHRHGKKWIPMSISNTYYSVAPAGGINASIADMGRWLVALTKDSSALLSRKTEEEIFHPVVRATPKNRYFWRWKPMRSAYYALGWRVLTFKNDTLDYHGGYVNGYRSEVAIHRKDKIAICVLVNAAGALADTSIPKFFELYSLHRDAIGRFEHMKGESIAGH